MAGQPTTQYPLEQNEVQLQYQKKWIWIHSIILLFVIVISIPLLHSKSHVLNDFYDQNQCCYCLWVSENNDVSDNYEIEWSTCKNKHKYSLDLHETCNINGNQYCENSDALTDMTYNELSYRSSFFFWIFPKFYPYYGIYNIILVSLYILLLLSTTYHFKVLISKQLFIGNLALTISVYYSYIKLYQYSLYEYDRLCPNPPTSTAQCYGSAFSKGLDIMFSLLVYATTIYSAYCIYVVYPCVCFIVVKCLSRYSVCEKIGTFMSVVLLYGAVIGGAMFVLISYIVLMWMVVTTDFGNGLINNVSANGEKTIIILIANTLLVLAFDMFFLKNCKQDLVEMFSRFNKKEEHDPRISLMSGNSVIDTDES